MRVDKAVAKANELITNKQARSLLFLIATFLLILGINALLPVVEGDAHYTQEAIKVTYAEYTTMKDENSNYQLTWLSERKIEQYIKDYIEANPNLTVDEKLLVNVPDLFVVEVYTKFFFQYAFWYITTITSLVSAVLLFYALFNYVTTKGKETNGRYVELSESVTKIVDKHIDPVTFEPWITDDFNKNRKIRQHINNIKYSLERLEHRTSYDIKQVFQAYYNDPTITLDFSKLSRRERKYFKKKERLLALLDDTYIQEYVVNGKVKYFRYIHALFVISGYNIIGRTTDTYSLIKSDTQRVQKDASTKVLYSVSMTVMFAILFTVTAVASYQQSPFWVIINVISKIVPLVMQVPLALDYSNVFMEEQLIGNLMNRRSICLLYLADTQKPKEVPHESNTNELQTSSS